MLEASPGEEAGLKSATMIVRGENAYGILKTERGPHRLVRLSPFDQAHRRHTSFAGVIVSPLLADDDELEIDESDLRIDTYRAQGAGGQHVNKTDSAVRITHLPTGIVAQCQNERSQAANKQTAMRILKSRLAELAEEEREAELAKERGDVQNIGFGGEAVRSYVLHPYQQVKDERTEPKVGNAQGVLDGDLDGSSTPISWPRRPVRLSSRAVPLDCGRHLPTGAALRPPSRSETGAGTRPSDRQTSSDVAEPRPSAPRTRLERGLDDRLRGRDEGLRAGRRRALATSRS